MSVSLVPAHARWGKFTASTAALTQYTFCGVNNSLQLTAPSATGVFAVILDDAPSNVAATLNADGLYTGGYVVGNYYGVVLPVGCVQKVYYGATLNPGVAVMTNTSGQAVANTTGVVLGYTLEAGNSGELHPILFAVA